MTTMYGIPNCDTIKKAKKFLTDNNIAFNFHDYRKDGIDEALLESFFTQLGWENVLNKRGTTYRALSEEQKQTLNEQNAKALLLESPAMIKRPILVNENKYYLGFKKEQYQEIFSL
ncbi:arsenate reductase [Pseudoalteromonas sp. A25]|uniref:ArsC family reductase n=1 Tax=Pseudoalteromonas sp. A25 TaxID=116092 RepID=UPI001260F09D|nr:ArsC family reductase [Pseudoalteromonas sp. A25]BBN81372.1 arsenate reductase [Pseudoalteromonas sp. A25]